MRNGSLLLAGPSKTKGKSACFVRCREVEGIENPQFTGVSPLRELTPGPGFEASNEDDIGGQPVAYVQYSTSNIRILTDWTHFAPAKVSKS